MVEKIMRELSERMCYTELTPEGIGRVMHDEMGITTDEITHFIFPFDNGGFMSARMMLRILLKKDRQRIDEMVRVNAGRTVSEEMLRRLYASMLKENITGLSENEIWKISTEELYADYEFGELSALIGLSDYDIRAGAFAVEAGADDITDIFVSTDGLKPCRFGFLKFTSKSALERVVRVCMLKLAGTEITAVRPVYGSDAIFAVRPPAGDWGIRIKGDRKQWGKE